MPLVLIERRRLLDGSGSGSVIFFLFSVFFFSEMSSCDVLGSPVIDQPSSDDDVVPIIAGVLGAIVGLFLLGLVCFCFIHKKKSRKHRKLNYEVWQTKLYRSCHERNALASPQHPWFHLSNG